MGAAEDYAALIDAANAQRQRVHGGSPPTDRWGGATARHFRDDPHRQMDPGLEAIASYLEPEDVFVDAGGGAGRISLPLALHCLQVVNVDASPGMGEEFQASAAEAGITNARFIQSDWLDSDGVQGDVTLTANVTYFVGDIRGFVQRLEAASRRRVMINICSVPNPYHNAKLFQLVYGEEQVVVPGHPQLLPVLWEMGILPDIRVMPGAPTARSSIQFANLAKTREDAIQGTLQGQWLGSEDRDRARGVIEAHFDDLFADIPEGFSPLWPPVTRQLLITWETNSRRSG